MLPRLQIRSVTTPRPHNVRPQVKQGRASITAPGSPLPTKERKLALLRDAGLPSVRLIRLVRRLGRCCRQRALPVGFCREPEAAGARIEEVMDGLRVLPFPAHAR